MGIDIFRVQGKGYQLAKPMQLPNQDIIQAQKNNHVDLIPIIDSTNQYLLDNINRLDSGSVCLSEYQLKGRGRRGREWISPLGLTYIFLCTGDSMPVWRQQWD